MELLIPKMDLLWKYKRLMRKQDKGYRLFFLVTFLGLAPVSVYAYQPPKYEIEASNIQQYRAISTISGDTILNSLLKPRTLAESGGVKAVGSDPDNRH